MEYRFHAKNLRQGRVSIMGNIYAITKCQNRKFERCLTDMQGLPEAIVDTFIFCQNHQWCRLAAFVVMPDHFHLIIQIQNKTLSETVKSICSFAYKYAKDNCGLIEAIWQNGFFDHAIRTDENLITQIEYVENNPVRAGLVALAGEWKYSSAHENCLTRVDRSWLYE